MADFHAQPQLALMGFPSADIPGVIEEPHGEHKKQKRNYTIRSDLAVSGFNGIIAVYFGRIESCTAECSCIRSAQISWKREC